MTYEQYRETKQKLKAAHDIATINLTTTCPMSSAFGHHEETVLDADFQAMYATERSAFANLRLFNANAPAAFSKMLRKEQYGY